MESKEPGFFGRGSGEWYSIFFLLYRCVLGFAAPWRCFVVLLDDWMIFQHGNDLQRTPPQ